MAKENKRCGCGRKKHIDADMCDHCYNKQRVYDDGCYGDNTICDCGNSKRPDVNTCQECWDKPKFLCRLVK